MGDFSNQIALFVNKVQGALKEEKKAMRKALNAGAKVIEKEIKKDVPVLDKSTDFRQRATVKNNIRHTTKIYKDGSGGITKILVKRTKGRKMARVSDNTKDRTDPFYWFMLERGTKKMKARPFMKKGFNSAKARAKAEVLKVYMEEMRKALQNKR
ncbi:TPA: HK97 gp10 family phage protein [Pasteurella multocida]|nr:HK97 gp10 family phage protein [Pasteurella multocida]HDR1099710.1 HK97 gp10 family phage protein [Pasteurella multocida]